MIRTESRSAADAAAFDRHLDEWEASLTSRPMPEIVRKAGGAERIGVFCVDLLNGFCHEGLLRSDGVRAIIPAIVSLFRGAYAEGVRHFVLPQDCHPPDAVEFTAFPPHCIRGTAEADTVPELATLPFADRFTVLPKRSLHPAIGTGLAAWLADHPEVTHRIVVGDCTDLCVYQLAMHLKLSANAENVDRPVIVPEDCVATYDLPIDDAAEVGAYAHPARHLHRVFLYHMALNGVNVVRSIPGAA
ncbi:MAG: cysteine hydrolase [Chthonomonadales bacterium]|nr:cysteine hydrolase [Chthonomonadales bacterium]